MAVYAFRDVVPRVGRDVFIAESASVIGDVQLGDGSSVWFGAVVRGDYRPIVLGARTNVQDCAVIHITSERFGVTIGDDVTLGHAAVVHACTIGNACLIGIGSIVLDGASVGEESFVAAGSLITPGTVVPPRSFVLGRPGRILRSTTSSEVDAIRESARTYAGFALDFRSGCKRVT